MTTPAKGVPDAQASAGGSQPRATQAPGQYLGYSLQVSRMLDHLLRAGPGSVVSLEVFADTGVQFPDGRVLAEEAKSRTTKTNPIADRALDFWKTLRNWVEAVQAGQLDPRVTQFRLWVSRAFSGGIAERFAAATTTGEARIAIAEARALLIGVADVPAPNDDGVSRSDAMSAAKSPTNDADVAAIPDRLRRHLDVVFGADPALVAQIVANLRIDLGTGRSLDELTATLDATFVPTEIANDVLQYALGWLKLGVDAQLERGEPASVAWDDFRTAVTGVVRRLDRRDFLASVARAPDAGRVEEHLRLRTYVRQLTLIDLEDDDKIRAVTDFIKAEVDRVDWAEKGHVVVGSFDEFEEELLAAWRNLKRFSEISHKHHPDAERGQLLFSHCFEHSSKLDGADVPEHFCRGSFHKLSDARAIGWHPSYADLLDSAEREAPTESSKVDDSNHASKSVQQSPSETGATAPPAESDRLSDSSTPTPRDADGNVE